MESNELKKVRIKNREKTIFIQKCFNTLKPKHDPGGKTWS